MSTPRDLHDEFFMDQIERNKAVDLASDAGTAFVKNLESLAKSRPETTEPETVPPLDATSRWGRVKAGTSAVWDNETTRTLIKAGGAFAGVALVAYSTIRKDHVMERQALAQANQRNS